VKGMTIEQILSLVLGVIIVGEAILMFIGMYLPGKKENEWKTRFNLNTLLIDLSFGLIIIFNAFEHMPLVIIALLALIVTHLYRGVEYFKKTKKGRFITNVPLFAVNTIKLIGLIVLLLIIL
jgi:phosphatidylglycerophosphate synthase